MGCARIVYEKKKVSSLNDNIVLYKVFKKSGWIPYVCWKHKE
jgi:hypothetical protein